jgi:hypothetical protein
VRLPKLYRKKCRHRIRPIKRMIVLCGHRDDGSRYDDYRIVTEAWIRRNVAWPEKYEVRGFGRNLI